MFQVASGPVLQTACKLFDHHAVTALRTGGTPVARGWQLGSFEGSPSSPALLPGGEGGRFVVCSMVQRVEVELLVLPGYTVHVAPFAAWALWEIHALLMPRRRALKIVGNVPQPSAIGIDSIAFH